MVAALDAVSLLTQDDLFETPRRLALQRFAKSTGWRPSYDIVDLPSTADLANGHLVVEHGLDNSAVLSFLKGGFPFSQLEPPAQRRLLSVSYNNLVDYQLFPDRSGMTFVYNRANPPTCSFSSIREDASSWSSESFQKFVSKQKPFANLRRLDDALIDTISLWKRLLPTEVKKQVTTDQIAALFNAIIFTRALEDHSRRKSATNGHVPLLIEQHRVEPLTVSDSLARAFKKLEVGAWPAALIARADIAVFDELAPETIGALFRDFYINRFAPYDYDFSIMSKHALSRVYEKYVSLLRTVDSAQLTLLPELPREATNREIGAYYTPQYIARFFTRFLHDNLTPVQFRNIRALDPACGSGMFLRTLLEAQCDPWESQDVSATAAKCIANTYGVDIDPNACHAARLSLALLHLVLTDRLPKHLNIVQADVADFLARKTAKEAFDAIVTNPPFVPWTRLSEIDRAAIKQVMTEYHIGRSDMYLVVLRLAIEAVKPGGYLLFVLPHSFLIAQSSARFRAEISRDFYVRVVADLSNVSVFEDVGAYVILLIMQKKKEHLSETDRATIIRCKDYVGHALQDALDGRRTTNDLYEIYDVDQAMFRQSEWTLLSKKQSRLQRRIAEQPFLDEFLAVRQGMNTGADEVFILPRSRVPKGESALYAPLLSDREMTKFAVPSRSAGFVFYPYLDGQKVSEAEIRESYKETWNYLKQHKKRLSERSSVKKGSLEWWSPERPRSPKEMLRPKIVTPHLVLVPKFSFDARGQFAVSRSPFLFPTIEGSDDELLVYFTCVLNSSVAYWQIATASHRYGGGYLMLEPKTLRHLRVPDPTLVPISVMRELVKLGRAAVSREAPDTVEQTIDSLVSDLYRLETEERKLLGIEQ